jgi:hypothetical protein
MRYVVLLLIFMVSCISGPVVSHKVKYPELLMKSCSQYCGGQYELLQRDKNTYFCMCSGKTVVMSKLGTIYK